MLTHTLVSQEMTLSNEYKKEVIDNLSTLLNDFYIYPDIAKKTSNHLYSQYEAGHFNKCEDNKTFANVLTEAVQSVSKDKHMRIMANKPYKAPENSLERKAEQRMDQINNYRNFNHWVSRSKIVGRECCIFRS